MQLDYWGQTKKMHAAIYLTLARLGRLLPQRLAGWTVTNKALKGRTKPVGPSIDDLKFQQCFTTHEHLPGWQLQFK